MRYGAEPQAIERFLRHRMNVLHQAYFKARKEKRGTKTLYAQWWLAKRAYWRYVVQRGMVYE